jgi:hypothetical protein
MRFRSCILLLPILISMGALSAHGQTTSSNVYIFPLFVDGTLGTTSFRSTLKITNTSSLNPMQCSLVQRNTSAPFTGIDGDFYSADVFDGGFSPPALTFPITLSNFLPFEILRTSAATPLKSGYAKLSCPGTVSTQLQFSMFSGNNKLSEATIAPAAQGNSFQFLVDRRDGTRLGFSLANDSNTGGQYELIARDQFNNIVDQNFEFLDPFSQVSKFVDEMLTLPSNFVGSVELVGIPSASSFAVGLQFTGTVFTTVQPLVRATPLPH